MTTQLRVEFSSRCPSVPGSVSFPTDFSLYSVDGGLECWILSLDGQVRSCRVYRGDSDFLNVTENLGMWPHTISLPQVSLHVSVTGPASYNTTLHPVGLQPPAEGKVGSESLLCPPPTPALHLLSDPVRGLAHSSRTAWVQGSVWVIEKYCICPC